MRGLGILILVVLFLWLVWPYIARWLKRKATERAEDYLRASMGMPPRDKKNRKKANYRNSEEEQTYYQRQRRNPFSKDRYTKGPIIPPEYAEDVEFTETIDYSSETHKTHTTASGETTSFHESQISDVEFTEIKKPRVK